jgi:NAD(P)H dehydrogenase (quinone)
MYAIMGITGQVGGAVADHLIASGEKVRAVVRNTAKASAWKSRGAQLVEADYDDASALELSFRDVAGVFAMIPPNFAPSPDLRELRTNIQALTTALDRARPSKVVYLSSIGAQHDTGLGLITALHLLEASLDLLPLPTAALRAGWFMENSVWDVAPARDQGKFFSYLQPLDHEFPLVATRDIGKIGADTLLQTWQGHRHLEVGGPRRYSPRDVAAAFSKALGKSVEPVAVPRDEWVKTFVAQGTPEDRTSLRVEMLDAFNSGWIDFGVRGTEPTAGTTDLNTVIQSLIPEP